MLTSITGADKQARLHIANAASDAAPAQRLTAAETRVVAFVAEGMTDKQIAEQAYLAVGTVREHIGSAFRKTGATNRVQLALAFLAVRA